MAVYTNDLRLKEIANGDESGTWGTSTNLNLKLIGEALSFQTEAVFDADGDKTTTVADGAEDAARGLFYKATSTTNLTATRVLTIGPATISRVMFIENATSGSQSITVRQSAGGTNVTIPNGQTKAVYLDGAASNPNVVDAFQDLSIPDLFIDDDLTFSSDSAVITFGADGDTTLTHTDGSGLTLNSTNKLMFNDASQFIQGSSATVLSLGATDEIDLTATAIDINGTVDVSGAATFAEGIKIDADNGDSPQLLFENSDGVTGDAAISTFDDSSGTMLVLGSNFYINSSGSETRFNTSEESTAVVLNRNGEMTLRTGGTGATAISRVDILATGAITINEAGADADFRIESDGQANMFFIDAADDAVVIGNNASRKTLFNTTATAAFQIEGTSGNTAAMSIVRNSNDDNGPQFVLGKSNGTSAGGVTVVTADALLGRISFQGADGTQTVEGARIEAFVNGTPGADDMPGRLVFSTTADGASTVTERMRIASNGGVGIGVTPTDGMDANIRYLHIGEQSIFRAGDTDFTDATVVATNLYQTGGTNKLITSGAGMSYTQQGGSHFFSSAASGSANDTVSLFDVLSMTSSEATFNDGANDIDFRIESTGFANQFHVDAGNNTVGIGRVASSMTFDVESASSGTLNAFRIRNSSSAAAAAVKQHFSLNRSGSDVDFEVASIVVGKEQEFTTTPSTVDGYMAFHTILNETGAERLRIKSTGSMTMTGASGTSPIFNLVNSDLENVNTGRESSVRFSGFRDGGESVDNAQISGNHIGSADDDKGGMLFYTNGGSGLGERMRITNADVIINEDGGDQDFRVESDSNAFQLFVDASLNFVGINKNNRVSTCDMSINAGSNPGIQSQNLTTGSSNLILDVRSNGTSIIGEINATNTATQFNTSSDYRLKENVETLKDGLDRLNQLKPVQFTWTTDGSLSEGFIAHEVEDLFPDAVSGEKDAVDEKGDIDPQQVDYGRITPLLVKAIQEQQEQIELLKEKISALENS